MEKKVDNMGLKVEKIFVPGYGNEKLKRFVITEDGKVIEEIYQWLELHSISSYLTGKEYAYVLVIFLRYLKKVNLHYAEVNDKATIEQYIKYLIYVDKGVQSLEGNRSFLSVKRHIGIIKNFYDWLEDNRRVNRNPVKFGNQKRKGNNAYVKKKFLYGQIWSFDLDKNFASKLRYKASRNHIKWYREEEIKLISKSFNSLRDLVIFQISIETGARIGEILGLQIDSFDNFSDKDGAWLYIRKRKSTENDAMAKTNERDLFIRTELAEQIQQYLTTERERVTEILGVDSKYLFLNFKGNSIGKALSPRNYLSILKRAAKRAGLDPANIRTHSGRSTRVQRLLEAKEEVDGVTEIFIKEEMGWNSIDSIEPYKKAMSAEQKKHLLEKIQDKVSRKEE